MTVRTSGRVDDLLSAIVLDLYKRITLNSDCSIVDDIAFCRITARYDEFLFVIHVHGYRSDPRNYYNNNSISVIYGGELYNFPFSDPTCIDDVVKLINKLHWRYRVGQLKKLAVMSVFSVGFAVGLVFLDYLIGFIMKLLGLRNG